MRSISSEPEVGWVSEALPIDPLLKTIILVWKEMMGSTSLTHHTISDQ
jgi:hypothetical protein